ncbi:FlgD immunoglobulin-like domain containing protein [candidate division KSB1 bacterium]
MMYLAGGKAIWRNDNLSQIPLNNNYDSISINWHQIIDTLTNTDIRISALAVSKNPANRLYFGTNKRDLYRIDSAHSLNHYNPVLINPVIVPPTQLVVFPSSGYMSCIAVDPRDADKVLVVFSNYNVFSLYYTADGGSTWIRASGNLEEIPNSGYGNGPSCRWASILPIGNRTAFFVGTSTGLYATDTLLKGDSTIWIQQGTSSIGSTVVDMIKTRESDGLVVVATHGNGIFSTNITDISQIVGIKDYYTRKELLNISVFPNPFHSVVTIKYNLPYSCHTKVRIFDISGKLINMLSDKKQKAGVYTLQWDGKDMNGNIVSKGLYFCSISSGDSNASQRIVFLK